MISTRRALSTMLSKKKDADEDDVPVDDED